MSGTAGKHGERGEGYPRPGRSRPGNEPKTMSKKIVKTTKTAKTTKTKKKKKHTFNHFVPARPRLKGFPFAYTPTNAGEVYEGGAEAYLEKHKPDLTIAFTPPHDNISRMIKNELIKIFPFHIYLDINSPKYIGSSGDNEIEYTVKVNKMKTETYEKKSGKEGTRQVLAEVWAVKLDNFTTKYQYNLIRSLEQLKEVLAPDHKYIGFDLEATGLNPDVDHITGVPFAMEPKIGYYLPIKHADEFAEFNLGFEALDMIYEKLCRTSIVGGFNGRFDMRLMEYCERHYDMSKVFVIDSQMTCWFADADYKQHNLKTLEKHFLGYYRIDLADTMRAAGIDGFNTSRISPENLLFYGAQDGISHLELCMETYKYFLEFKISGKIDQKLLYPLMKFENEPILIDTDYLKEQMEIIKPRLDALDKQIIDQIGDINLNSSKQKIELFESFGLDTGVKTKAKKMSTGKDAIDALLARMKARGDKIPVWLTLLNERSHLNQLYGTFFYSLYVQAMMNNNRIRINYRNTVAATGRLSSGKEEL